MKRLFFIFLAALALTGCGAILKVTTANMKSNVNAYVYAYVIPPSGVTSSSGVHGHPHGASAASTNTANPSEAISGYLMKKGYTVVPSVTPDLAERTLIVSYGYTGRRQLSLFSYASCIIVQMRDAKTHEMVASCEAEGCGSDETEDILQAIYSGLNSIFAEQ